MIEYSKKPVSNDLESLGLLVADHVSAMLAYWDSELVCRFANAAYLDWFGKTREEMVGKITIKELLGNLFEKNLPYIQGVLNGEPQTFEREITTPSGEIRHSIANYFPDINNGVVKGFFVHVANITELKLLEKKLLLSNEIIGDQNKRLMGFANIVSHNLKSYANNLKSILDIFQKSESQEEKDLMLMYLKNISVGFSNTVSHLTELVEFQNQAELKIESINLHEYIQQSLGTLSVQIKSCNAIFRNKVSPDTELAANPAYMESILLNLLTNAIKYRRKDVPLNVDIDAEMVNDELRLKIKDNGLGINLDRHKNDIFGIYKTFHGNSDAKGIGLFITKLQVEAMKGTIKVESQEMAGTTFTLTFPLTTPKQES